MPASRSTSHPANVVVTGAGGGVGSALVARLDSLGYRVFAGIRRDEARAALPSSPGVVPVVFDTTGEASVEAAASWIATETGDAGLQALVNVAGLMRQGPLELTSAATLRQQFDVTVLGTMTVTRAFLPLLRLGQGRVVNVGAVTGRVTMPFAGPISAAETALESLSDALRMELRHQGVAVSLVELGGMDTTLFAKAGAAAEQDIGSAAPALQAIYASALEAVGATFAKQKLSSPEVAVKSIVKALTDRSPDARYLAGRDARLIAKLRRLPDGLRDRLILRALGIKPAMFRRGGGDQPLGVGASSSAATMSGSAQA